MEIQQWSFTSQRYGLVDYLPYMYQRSTILVSALPIPIVTYDSIVYPYDQQVWGFMFTCIIAQFLLLQAMQYLYCKVSGTPNNMEYIYAGIPYKFITIE